MLYGGVHIKEASATRMAVVDDNVAYIGLKDAGSHLQLYKCMIKHRGFEDGLQNKLARAKQSNHDENVHKKQNLREYLKQKLPKLEAYFGFTLVTDIENDHLLTVRVNDGYFVYFGAMTSQLVHVACWLRLQISEPNIDYTKAPKIFFWVLHESYAQEIEALSELETMEKSNMVEADDQSITVETELNLQAGIESS